MKQIIEIYKQYIDTKAKALEAEIKTDPELEAKYKELQFTEKVITGHANIVGRDISQKAHAVAAMSLKRTDQQIKAINRAQLMRVASKSRKHKGRGK